MNKELMAFILHWRWFFKKEGFKKSKIRESVAGKFMASKEYKEKKWTTEMFCLEWNEMEKKG